MDGRDLWRVAACANSNASSHVNRIMLRFRPIAPKPVTASSGGGAGEGSRSSHVSALGKRPKRKYVRIRRNSGYVRRNNGNNSKRNNNNGNSKSDDVAVVTLQLMPEKDAPEADSVAVDAWCKNVDLDLDLTVESPNLSPKPEQNEEKINRSDRVPVAKVAESWVTVESVTGTCMGEEGEEGGIGCTDAERLRRLESDTCPGFVCDGTLKVRWVNDAYKRMVVSEERDCVDEDIVVWLKVKDSASAAWWCYSHPAFACGVRLQYTWRNEKCTKMVPCDVWRLDCGGFAWRLDVKAALSLGI